MTIPPALATIAALHNLLTERPDLAALPIHWTVAPDGSLTGNPLYLAEGSHATVRTVAAVLGAEVREFTVTDSGEVLAAVEVSGGRLGNARVCSTGYVLAETLLSLVGPTVSRQRRAS
ncbi:hypothetical protein ACIQOW_03545 [Kitasatospora sp. NPDC091335]|uniref:hypothetical protein n=1 Tax=Kitasatospora sp. NPDC091335 TaxID=3364085 RepID=UPI00382A9428